MLIPWRVYLNHFKYIFKPILSGKTPNCFPYKLLKPSTIESAEKTANQQTIQFWD